MTEKVVNGRVEDVLSSIKRLVGEKDRQTSDTTSSIARKPGRLVLTDALRVGGMSSTQDGPENEQEDSQDEAETKKGYTADASVKPMLLRACDIVNREDPANKEPAAPEPVRDATNSLSAKIEALEAAIARTEDQWEPDGDSEDEYSGTPAKALEFSARKEFAEAEQEQEETPKEAEVKEAVATTKATFVRAPEVNAAASAPPAAEEEPMETALSALDEEALRTLVAQVVREELQGVLGERITRNVRKMVRREIYKALAEQKLE